MAHLYFAHSSTLYTFPCTNLRKGKARWRKSHMRKTMCATHISTNSVMRNHTNQYSKRNAFMKGAIMRVVKYILYLLLYLLY